MRRSQKVEDLHYITNRINKLRESIDTPLAHSTKIHYDKMKRDKVKLEEWRELIQKKTLIAPRGDNVFEINRTILTLTLITQLEEQYDEIYNRLDEPSDDDYGGVTL